MKMKVLILAGCMFLSVVSVAQQSEVRSIGTFKGVKSAEGIDVYLKKGDKESVKVESNKELSDVITEISGSYLKIHIRDNNNSWGGGSRGRSVKVYVTYVDIDKIAASSASNVFSDGVIKAGSMEIHASSAANIEVSVDATDLDVHCSSAGDVTLEGKAKSINAEVSSAGEINGYNLQVENAEASASSGGGIKISVSQGINARASSGGSIRYRGNPAKTNSNSSSGGSVTRAN